MQVVVPLVSAPHEIDPAATEVVAADAVVAVVTIVAGVKVSRAGMELIGVLPVVIVVVVVVVT